MESHIDVILFLLETARSLMQKYIKEFDWKSSLNATQILEPEVLEKTSATFLKVEKIPYNDIGYLSIRLIWVF
jgi:hypothetical protein